MRILLLVLFFSSYSIAASEWPYYQVTSGDTLESIGLSLYGSSSALTESLSVSKLPAVGKYLKVSPTLLRLKCNIREGTRYIKINYRMVEVRLVGAKNQFKSQKELTQYLKKTPSCINNLKPWRRLSFISYAVAMDQIEEKSDEVSTQTRVTAIAGLEYLYRHEMGWISPWVLQLRGRVLKGSSTKGYSLGPQIDLELGLGKEVAKNTQVIYGKIWRSLFDFVGNKENDFVDAYTNSSYFAGGAYEYIKIINDRPWIAELGVYYKVSGGYTPMINGKEDTLSGYALRASLKIPLQIEDINTLFVEPRWQFSSFTGRDYELFVNQFSISAGMRF
jgi:hypothetical protein